MLVQGIGHFLNKWWYNHVKYAINGWDISRRDKISGEGLVVYRFIKFLDRGVGCVVGGRDMFRGGRFQSGDFRFSK